MDTNIIIRFCIILIFFLVLFIFTLGYQISYYSNLVDIDDGENSKECLKEIDQQLSGIESLHSYRNELFFEGIQSLPKLHNKYIQISFLKKFVLLHFKEYFLLLSEFNKDGTVEINEKLFLVYFKRYIQKYHKYDFIQHSSSLSEIRFQPFIKDMPDRISERYKYNENIKIKNVINNNKTNEEFINRVGLFLENYKYIERNDKFFERYLNKNKGVDFYKKERTFKEYLKFLWKVGNFITFKLNNNEKLNPLHLELFDRASENLLNIPNKGKQFPFGYDWFLFASHYPTILSYKLYIDYKLKRNVNHSYYKKIIEFIPRCDYSKNIKRDRSNVAIMSINYIIAYLFKFHDRPQLFKNVIDNIYKSNLFEKEIIIQYQVPDKTFSNGLYFDGGFISHKNLVSYNYLLAYLYPTLFYKVVFDAENHNFNRIFKSFDNINIPKRKVNPSLVSRFGLFDECDNSLSNFIKAYKNCNLTTDNYFLQKYLNLEENKFKLIEGIYVIKSARIIVANYNTWSFQMKINSELSFGEVDIFNNNILKQLYMNKILLFDDMDIEGFEHHSKYPGVLSYKKYLNKAERFDVKYGTYSFTFDNVSYSFIEYDKDLVISYSVVNNRIFKISYEELVVVTQYGILVGYFNIKKQMDDDLFLTITSNIYKNNIVAKIIYSDNEEDIIIEKDYIYKKVDKNIIYTNLIINSEQFYLKNIEIDSNNILVNIIYNRNLNIVLDKIYGLGLSIK